AWQRLKPGVHPLGHAIDADTIVVSTADKPLEITVPTAALARFEKRVRLFAEVELELNPDQPPPIVQFSLANQPSVLLGTPHSPLVEELRTADRAFCRVFPNRFVYVDSTRGLSAGFHLIEGVFRDDVPLCQLVLSDAELAELDRLWDELYFGTGMNEKMLRG